MTDRFGINIKQYCREHESALRNGKTSLEQHLEKLRWLQHERLVHLIVVVMVVVAELFVVDLAILHPETNPLAGIAMLVLAVLLGFYFYHYFFLENTVQRWYKLSDQLRQQTAPTASDTPSSAIQRDINAIRELPSVGSRENQ